ncbi:unnamed protein product, partial [Darwinula stevensoni]
MDGCMADTRCKDLIGSAVSSCDPRLCSQDACASTLNHFHAQSSTEYHGNLAFCTC